MQRLSQECYDLIIGTLLGDGWLAKTKKGKRKNSYLGICHSIKQVEYLNHKFEILKEVGAKKICDKSYTRNKKVIRSKEFVTKSIDIFTKLRKELYPKGKKKITKKYLDKVSDRALAYWIMDDGSLVWHKRKRKKGKIYSTCEFYLSVNCFTKHEIELVKNWLYKKYSVKSKITYHNPSNSFVLVINRINYNILISYIKPYIIPSMDYKINMDKLGKLVEEPPTPANKAG